jgi:archaemetzincin
MNWNGDPHESDESYKLCLLRTLKTGGHEVGHMLGMHHCIFFECMMNGSNHRIETDNRPIHLCPVCLKKMYAFKKFELIERYDQLENLCRKWDLECAETFRLFKKHLEEINEENF